MSFLGRILDDRDDRAREQAAADEAWLRERVGIDPAERLQSWDRWLRGKLATSLAWPKDEAARARLMGQCAAEVTVLAKQLRGRGWLLDGKALASHVEALLAPIGKAQREGKVGDFWPYFRASVSRYVGANAEEIQQHARRVGADEGAQAVGSVLAGIKIESESMVELLARRAVEVREAKTEALREKQARLRAKEAACKAAAQQQQLF